MPYVMIEGRQVWVPSIDIYVEGRPPTISYEDFPVEGREFDDSELRAQQYAEELNTLYNDFYIRTQAIIYRSPGQGADAIKYLQDTLGLPYSLAQTLLPDMAATLCARSGLVFAIPSPLQMVSNDQAVQLFPAFYGGVTSTPQYFLDLVSIITDLVGYDLEVFVDEIYNQVNTLLAIPQFVEWWFTEDSSQSWIKALVKIVVITGFIVTISAMMGAQAYASAQTSYSAALSQGVSKLAAIKAGISTFLDTMKVSIGTFLKAIHYDTIVSVHRVAFLVSEDYRKMVTGVYNEIATFSASLGLGSTFILSAMQNARSIVLTTSTLLGRKYDMAEISWLATFHDYLKVFQSRAYRYRNNPGAVLYDLDQLITRDAIDAQGMAIRGIFESIKEVSSTIQTTVNRVVTLRDEVNEFVADLPLFIRKEIEPELAPIIARFDQFITQKYDPLKREFNTIIQEIGLTQIEHKTKVDGLIDRLKRPGDYLGEIERFAGWEKVAQERKVSEIASRQLGRDTDVLKKRAKELSTELGKVTKAIEHVSLLPLTMPVELEGLSRPIGVKAKERTSWNVGDY